MKQFAFLVDGHVVEVIPEFVRVDDGETATDVPIVERYHADFIAQLVPFDPEDPPTGPETEPQPAIVPSVVSMAQARVALIEVGKIEAVQAAIEAIPGIDGQIARARWEFATTVERSSPLVAVLAAELQLDDTQLDALFQRAAQL